MAVAPAASRETLDRSEVFAHWSLDAVDEPALAAAEAHCREAAIELVDRLPLGPADRPAAECDEATLLGRLGAPDDWSDVGVRPELSDLVALHTGDLRAETSVAEPREQVRQAMVEALDRRGWCPPGTDWAISGHLWYRPGSLLGWHTNTRVPGWRAYLSWAAEPGRSFFRYRDPHDGQVHTSWDTGLDLRLFHVSTTDVLWHCVWSGTERHSFGYRLIDATA
jgi:hypothetical protein